MNWAAVRKAVYAYLVTAVGSVTGWLLTIPDTGPIPRKVWIALAVAILTPHVTAAAVYKVKNAPSKNPEPSDNSPSPEDGPQDLDQAPGSTVGPEGSVQ